MLTIFAIPKSFEGADDLHQRNAINSWKQLVGGDNVLLIGDDSLEAHANELGVRCVAGVELNEHGTPLISSAFELAKNNSSTPYLAYSNCDMILFGELLQGLNRIVSCSDIEKFFATTLRINLPVDGLVDFGDTRAVTELKNSAHKHGEIESLVCKDVMIFPRGLYSSIPDFAVGRGNWDNWMVVRAKQLGAAVVRMQADIPTVHQAHSYDKFGASKRRGCYVTSAEAQMNQRLAGGRHLIAGSTCDYFLDGKGLRPNRTKWIHGEFWRDFPRFAGLLLQLSGLKRGN